ncbi:MAG: hypothetical protein LCH52_03860 [Bacteroidetes bacterium]|nr:hypothetical protein [Bacteroidota bacterium]
MKQDNNEKIWANGLTIDKTIEEYNRIYRKITLQHLKIYKCKHKTDIVAKIYAGKINETEL